MINLEHFQSSSKILKQHLQRKASILAQRPLTCSILLQKWWTHLLRKVQDLKHQKMVNNKINCHLLKLHHPSSWNKRRMIVKFQITSHNLNWMVKGHKFLIFKPIMKDQRMRFWIHKEMLVLSKRLRTFLPRETPKVMLNYQILHLTI